VKNAAPARILGVTANFVLNALAGRFVKRRKKDIWPQRSQRSRAATKNNLSQSPQRTRRKILDF
jgi:hypothetical protein